jgi:hypothetical protein
MHVYARALWERKCVQRRECVRAHAGSMSVNALLAVHRGIQAQPARATETMMKDGVRV